jgi:hypothetical protein
LIEGVNGISKDQNTNETLEGRNQLCTSLAKESFLTYLKELGQSL